MKITFDKSAELIFGLIYSVNREYNIDSKCLDTLPLYCNEFI